MCNDVTRPQWHENDVIMGAIASQITSLTIVYSIVYSDADQRKHQSSASLAFVRGIHREPVNSPHKWPVTRKMFPFDDVIMSLRCISMFHWYQLCQCSSWPYDVIWRHWATMCAPSSPLTAMPCVLTLSKTYDVIYFTYKQQEAKIRGLSIFDWCHVAQCWSKSMTP